MFRVVQSPKFWSEVEVEIIPEEGGKPKKFAFQQQFPRMTTDELRAFGDHIVKQRLDDPQGARLLLTGEWKKAVYPDAAPDSEEAKIEPMKWKGVVDAQDQPLEPTTGNIDGLLKVVGLGSVLCKKFYADIGKAGAKN